MVSPYPPRVEMAVMSYQLKILSGVLSGVEYSLLEGDSIFHIGSHRDLVDGRAEHLLGQSENAFFLPTDLPASAFMVRTVTEGDRAPLELGERDEAGGAWTFRPLLPQQIECVAGIYVAVRDVAFPWQQEVLEFVVPTLPSMLPPVESEAAPTPSPRRVARLPVALTAMTAFLLVALAATWLHWRYLPETRVRDLSEILSAAPENYSVVAGDQRGLYVFAETAAGKAWGERASRRLGRGSDMYLVAASEADRLERLLERADIELVVVRLDVPSQPQVVITGTVTPERRQQVMAALSGQVPYATRLDVTSISDARLAQIAQRELKTLGIPTRLEPEGTRSSVVNDTFLNDAGLNAMARAAERFHQRWGRRRITIQPMLWDDLLQDRSYQYSPGQLMSVGSGRWGYARAAGSPLNIH